MSAPSSRRGGRSAELIRRLFGVSAVLAVLLLVAAACSSTPPPAPSGSASPGAATGSPRATAPATQPGVNATPTFVPGTPATPTPTNGSPGSPAPTASGGPVPTATPATPTGTPGPGGTGDVLPTPETTDVVLLVGDGSALTADEDRWLGDLRTQLGKVDTLAYRDVTADALRAYLVIFVIGQSSDLDVGALAQAYQEGLTVHLIGPAAGYEIRGHGHAHTLIFWRLPASAGTVLV